jgi:anti-anti-sigma factor
MPTETVLMTPNGVVALVPVETVAQDDWRAGVRLRGHVDLANADQVLAELQRHVEAGRRLLRVDTTDVEFIDSTAMSALVTVDALCRAQQGSLILTGTTPRLRRLLSIAGLDRLLLVDNADHDRQAPGAEGAKR